ncbi:TetR/AcrR family transcriptional regulator [Shewanella sp. FJAT-52076]|uniref:TetR/AcrR family transcriptional regulator n=1 Tax=Shewanella sp. FJAT-52076 TaxID=2864202 RepID=UPI001C6581BB|nr:TetR/AcrR family transcriptional regulator [Shewanella sp. FJAT-52076]QYJ75359.1 TetR/AcrR family transcriptional regulator [Shewanella sp. FJAT-52076]
MSDPGRPKGDSDARARLIAAAIECFTERGYQAVSTRSIARKAGVDAAMIRYYFGGKPGLFEHMVREVLSPVLAKFQSLSQQGAPSDLAALMQTYYRAIGAHPRLPRLILTVLHEGQSSEAFRLLMSVFGDVLRLSHSWLMQSLVANGAIRADVDPQLARLSLISLMVFPLIAPPALVDSLGIDTSPDGLMSLVPHHIAVLSQGILASDAGDKS